MKTKQKNQIKLNQWCDYTFKLNSEIVTPMSIVLALDSFKSKILQINLPESVEGVLQQGQSCDNKYTKEGFDSLERLNNLKLFILFKIKTVTRQHRTISYMQTLNITEYPKLYLIFMEY